MAKIFNVQAELNNHPNRNNFDLSHKIHMSGKMGLLYPVFCKPVVPGDSFRIDSGCAFNFMPMPYPTQTRMRFVQHFFYVRNKNLWKNWENWLEGLPSNDTGETPVPPYIDQPASFYKTGSLADFLNIPTTLQMMDSVHTFSPQVYPNALNNRLSSLVSFRYVPNTRALDTNFNSYITSVGPKVFMFDKALDANYIGAIPTRPFSRALPKGTVFHLRAHDQQSIRFGYHDGHPDDVALPLRFRVFAVPFYNEVRFDATAIPQFLTRVVNNDYSLSPQTNSFIDLGETGTSIYFEASPYTVSIPFPDQLVDRINSLEGASKMLFLVPMRQSILYYDYDGLSVEEAMPFVYEIATNVSSRSGFPYSEESGMVDIETVPQSNPYYSTSNQDTDTIRLSALPFRAYESIYNAFYRNTNGNQPFTIDGRVQYNKYNTTTDDGADKTDYHLFNRNWELDAYTSCLPSPQQGAAPVVGISALGEVTITDPETGVTTTARATDTPHGMQISDVNLGDQTHQRYLVNLATSGITINDFRNVNALQRFLETNIRKGYRYVDFIEGHFGVKIKGAILDMPEFIGGFSQSVDVNMVTNTTAGEKAGIETLGDYGGQASAFGGTKHSINHFCDDYGFIIGIMCLVPEPTYSQILPKHFNIKQPLDYYFPEFSQIGMQPITYEELCPVQSHYQHSIDSNIRLTDVFGYQRPNHDMVWFPDTLHGEFRKSFNRYIVNRVYAERPELGEDFLIIKPEETNSIFNYTAPDADVFLGQVAFDVKAKRPVPRIVIPSLGR